MFTATIKQFRLQHRRCAPHVRHLTATARGHNISHKRAKHASLDIIASSECDFEPKSEAWYNHHFSVAKKLLPEDRRTKSRRCLSLLKSKKHIELRVPQRLRLDPLDFACLDRADDATLSSCLELYIARINEQARDLAEARARYLQDRPGTKALLALSRLGYSHHTMSLDRYRLFRSVTHCLVAENEEKAVWQWAKDDSRSGPHATSWHSLDLKNHKWKIDLMRCLVEAQLHWTPDADFTASALVTLITQDDVFRLSEKRSAMIRLVEVLFASSATCQNVHLFNKFRSITRALFHVSDTKWLYVALLDLAHPKRPSADKYLQWLQKDIGSDRRTAEIERHFDPNSRRAVEGLLTELYRAIRVCLITGRREDAVWILDFAYSQKPQLFGTAITMQRLLSDLERVHSNANLSITPRRATASEIEAGAAVDELGYLVYSPEMINLRLTAALRHGVGHYGGRVQ